jgi:hypothetical protein
VKRINIYLSGPGRYCATDAPIGGDADDYPQAVCGYGDTEKLALIDFVAQLTGEKTELAAYKEGYQRHRKALTRLHAFATRLLGAQYSEAPVGAQVVEVLTGDFERQDVRMTHGSSVGMFNAACPYCRSYTMLEFSNFLNPGSPHTLNRCMHFNHAWTDGATLYASFTQSTRR